MIRSKLLIFVLVLLCFVTEVFCQSNPNAFNLIVNGSFESGGGSPPATPGCYDHYSGGGLNPGEGMNNFNNDVYNWDVARLNAGLFGDRGSPDWLNNACGTHPAINNTSRYIHCSSEIENIRSELFIGGNHYNLIQGKKYILKYKYMPISGNGCFRVFFTKWGEHWNSNSNNNQKWEAIDCNVVWSTFSDGFISETRTFIAPSGSNYNELGNIIIRLCDDVGSSMWTQFHIDDIELYEEDVCPNVRAIENTIYWQQNWIFQASNILKAGYDVNNPNTDNGNVEVKYNSNIIYRAGNQVILEPGFSTEYGCFFETVIEPCEANPCPSPPIIPPVVSACFGNSTNIGVSNSETGLLYSWSPSTYLDDPTSPNPVFNPPSGSGSITYTVTVSSICGYINLFPNYAQTITQEVNVYWNDNPDPTPLITLNNIQTTDYDFSLDIAVGSQTEYVCFYFNEISTGDLIATYCLSNDQFYAGTGFTCCNFTIVWDDFPNEIRELLSACEDYNVTVASQNFCYTNAAYQSFLWNRNNNLNINFVSNVMSIPDSPNEYFVADVSGVDDFHVIIFNPSGGEVHNQEGIVLDNPIILWDGWCDGANCALFFGQECWVINGTYFYTLELTNSCGNQINTSGYLTVFHDQNNLPCVRSTIIIDDSTENSNNEKLTEILIYPNPSNGHFEINFPNELVLDNIFLYDNTGRLIFETEISIKEIDLSSYSNGIYFLEINTDQGIFREKIIKQ